MWCDVRGEGLVAVVLRNDVEACQRELDRLNLDRFTTLVSVDYPKFLRPIGRLWGGRIGYLLWRIPAKRRIREIAKFYNIRTIHQVTWATFLLPPACPYFLRKELVWGPAGIPALSIHSRFSIVRMVIWAIQESINLITRINTTAVGRLIPNNLYTARILHRNPALIGVEPPIFLPEETAREGIRDHKLISTMGLLIKRKRPELAIRAIADSRLTEFRLQFLGHGPLLEGLRQLAIQLGVEQRVSFLGWKSRSEALDILCRSGILLHPASREGAGWVVAEALTLGIPAVVFESTGAESVVRSSGSIGVVCEATQPLESSLVQGVLTAFSQPKGTPSKRWREDRLQDLLTTWWAV